MATPALARAEERRRFDALSAHDFNVTRAAIALDMPRGTLSEWWSTFQRKMAARYGDFIPDSHWEEAPAEAAIEPAPPPVSDEVLELELLRRRLKTVSAERDALLSQVADSYSLRRAVQLDEPIEPVHFAARPADQGSARETAILLLSDLHYGEVVDLGAMDGVNSYSMDIARARLRRCFSATVDLLVNHSPDPGPERVILILGGDLVSGDIHLELSKTNEASALPAARDLVAHLIGGIDLLIEELGCPIDVISLVGNHGRSTFKPESKNSVLTSYDTLTADFLELHYRNNPQVSFFVPSGPDAVFTVYGWRLLATHGDRIGSRGGTGFVGCAASAARGFKKIVMEQAALGRPVDYILAGHFHTALRLEEGWVNGSLVGPNEYGRDARFRPAPATQLLLTLHPQRGVVQERRIQVGAPDEGPIYAPPPARADTRPRYRVPAVGVAA
jgi:hypothetical protein